MYRRISLQDFIDNHLEHVKAGEYAAYYEGMLVRDVTEHEFPQMAVIHFGTARSVACNRNVFAVVVPKTPYTPPTTPAQAVAKAFKRAVGRVVAE